MTKEQFENIKRYLKEDIKLNQYECFSIRRNELRDKFDLMEDYYDGLAEFFNNDGEYMIQRHLLPRSNFYIEFDKL
jgi:hypothetical protein